MIPRGVSGQANPLYVSVSGGCARLPAAKRCPWDATTIGVVREGWHTFVGVLVGDCAAATAPNPIRLAKAIVRRGRRENMRDPWGVESVPAEMTRRRMTKASVNTLSHWAETHKSAKSCKHAPGAFSFGKPTFPPADRAVLVCAR